MVKKRGEKLYIIKTAPAREQTVIDLIEQYYLCKPGEEYGQVTVVESDVEIEPKLAKKGRAFRRRLTKIEREALRKKQEEDSGEDVLLSEIPKYSDEVKLRKTGLGYFGATLHGMRHDVDRRICLVDEVVVPDLTGYIVVATKDRKYANSLVRKIRHAWKVLDGTVSRRELDTNIKEIEERTRIDTGDFVIPLAGSLKGIKSQVTGVTFDGRYKLKTVEGFIPIDFTISKENLIKEGVDAK